MSEGESNPARDSAANATARNAAVSAALADIPDDFGAPSEPSAAATTGEPTPSEPSAEASGEPTASDSGASQGQPGQAVPKTQLEAPKNWPKDRRDEFATLPDNVKSILLAREKEFNQGLTKNAQENAEHRKRSEAISSVFNAEHRKQMESAGVDEIGAVRQFVALHDFFTRDPVGYLKHLIGVTGVKQDQLFGGQPQQQTQPAQPASADDWVDPHVIELRSELQTLKAENQHLKQNFTQFQSSYSQREQLSLREEVDRFKSAADQTGNPAYPHYDAVMPIMRHLMDADPEIAAIPDWKAQDKLKAAYEKAVWMNPDVRQALIDNQVNQSLSSQLKTAEVERAKAAASKRPSPGANGAAQPGKMSRQEAVSAAMRSVGL